MLTGVIRHPFNRTGNDAANELVQHHAESNTYAAGCVRISSRHDARTAATRQGQALMTEVLL